MPKRKPSRKKKTQNRFSEKKAKGKSKGKDKVKSKVKSTSYKVKNKIAKKSSKQNPPIFKFNRLPQLTKSCSLPWVKLKTPGNWVPVTKDISRTLHSDRIFEDGSDPTSQRKILLLDQQKTWFLQHQPNQTLQLNQIIMTLILSLLF